MTIESSKDNHILLLKGLQSTNQEIVIETLEELRVSGRTSDIPVLLELLHTTQNADVKTKIIALFSNLKESEGIPMIIEAILDKKYALELKQLVSCCWENGLDYSKYLSVFVDILIDSDFLVAFEAYTVITNMVTTIDQSEIDIEIEKIDQAMHTTTVEKKALMLDVIDFLPSIGY